MCVQADKLCGALMWCSAGLTVLYMLSSWTVPEGMAVSYEVYLTKNKHTQAESGQRKTHFNYLSLTD